MNAFADIARTSSLTQILLMPSANISMSTSQDSDFLLTLTLKNNGSVIDLTGISFEMEVYEFQGRVPTGLPVGSPVTAATITNNGADGILMLTIQASEMFTLAPGMYYGDLIATADGYSIVAAEITFEHTRFGACVLKEIQNLSPSPPAANSSIVQAGPPGPAPFTAPVPYTSGLNATAIAPATAVTYESSIYICTVSHLTTPTFDPTKWQQWLGPISLTIARAQVSSVTIPFASFLLAGHDTVGDRGQGALYVLGTSSGPHAIQDASGQWFNIAGGYDGVNVGWFGAKGDGATDDTTAINAAHTYAASIGADLYFPAGRFMTTGLANLTQPLRGKSRFVSTIAALPSASSHTVSASAAATGWSFLDLTIDSGGYGAHSLNLPVGVTVIRIERYQIKNSGASGIYASGVVDCQILDGEINNTGLQGVTGASGGAGMWVIGSRVKIFRNNVTNTTGSGISGGSYLPGGSEIGDMEVAFNYVANSGSLAITDDNITIYGSTNQFIKVHDNVCRNARANHNIHVGGNQCEVCDNDCSGSVSPNIYLGARVAFTETYVPTYQIKINRNRCDSPGAGYACIQTDLCDQLEVHENHCTNAPAQAIMIGGPCYNLSCKGNIIEWPGLHGIEYSGVINGIIADNIIDLYAVGSVLTLGSLVGGSGYTDGIYPNIPLTGGTGSGITATITISGGVVTSVVLVRPGNGATVGDVLTASAANIGGTGAGFSIDVATTVSAPAGNCIVNGAAPGTPAISSFNVRVAGNVMNGGVYAAYNSDPLATIIYGLNLATKTQSSTLPYFMHSNDVIVGDFGGADTTGFEFGANVSALGSYAGALGNCAQSKNRSGCWVWANGKFVTAGDAQRGQQILFGSTGAGTTASLTADGTARNTHNILNLASSNSMVISGKVIISDSSGNQASFDFKATGRNVAGIMSLVGSASITQLAADSAASGWTLSITADATNLGFSFSISAAANCFAVAAVEFGEIIW